MVRIDPLRAADAEVIARLQNHLWRVTYAGLLPEAVLATRDDDVNAALWRDRAEVHERTGRSAEGACTVVAHDDGGRPIGWATTGPSRDDAPPTAAELWSLYVAAEHQGSGVAHQLLAAVLPSSAAAHLWVLSGNDRAIAFYRKVGFEPDGGRKHDPRLGADELRMVRGA